MFERKETYNQQLQKIRTLPQETSDQKKAKQEAARQFRVDVLWDNARIAENIISQIESNPWVGNEDLLKGANSIKYLAHPEAVKDFIDNLSGAAWNTLEKTRRVEYDTPDGMTQAEYIYSSVVEEKTGSSLRPRGKVELDKDYSLAVILYISDKKDFKLIEDHANIAGFYRSGNYIGFPLIVVFGKKPDPSSVVDRVTVHEKGHAENDPLSSTDEYRHNSAKFFWGSLGPFFKNSEITDFMAVHNQKSYEGIDLDAELAKMEMNPIWQKLLNFALNRAKDELLAALKSGEKGFKMQFESLMMREDIYKERSVYDFFKKRGIPTDSVVYSTLWRKYFIIIYASFKTVLLLIDRYKSIKPRANEGAPYPLVQQFRWVLAQIPIEKWPLVLKKSGFFEDSQAEAEFEISLKLRKLGEDYLEQHGNKLAISFVYNNYRSFCKQYHVPYNKKFIAQFLFDHGWITEKERDKRFHATSNSK